MLPPCSSTEGCARNTSDGIKIAVKDVFNQTVTRVIARAGKTPSSVRRLREGFWQN